ncbi:uncharacterized protein [Typha latifolia]|uniref:uncharacterized protein isoform X1 n=1 Tax=Typha latifolia TaxID=4733 RepID=UPI003C2FF2CB
MASAASPKSPAYFGSRRRLLPSKLFSLFAVIAVFSFTLLVFIGLHTAIWDAVIRTRTLVGHNLDPTPWHRFPHPNSHTPVLAVFRCTYLSCPLLRRRRPNPNLHPFPASEFAETRSSCPSFFSSIHRDLAPWRRSRISASLVAEAAARHAAMRVIVSGGGTRLFVDLYYACVQSRALFTVWGILQLMRRYPGMIPDVDLVFDCMDRPAINRSDYGEGMTPPPPLFRYCTTKEHWDIPFPDWSFWGWPEINIKPWAEEFRSIKLGAQAVKWKRKTKTAYWKGNPDVDSPIRMALLSCNDSKKWGAQIIRQNWVEESSSGFQNSNLSSQCNHRYKIYAEGFAWSVSLKYILSCGSLAFIVDPQYEDFFSRGLIPKHNYWPINSTNLCQSIKSAVDWGNEHPSEAEAIGKRGQTLMQDLNMDQVYEYMYHLIMEYSKLQDFKPNPPSTAQEVCVDSLLCVANSKQRQFLERSYASPSPTKPCTLPPPSNDCRKKSMAGQHKISSGMQDMQTRFHDEFFG